MADEVTTAPSKPASRVRAVVREAIETLILAVVMYMGIQTALYGYHIDGICMEPNFYTDERVLVNKLAYVTVDTSHIRQWLPFAPAVGPFYPLGLPGRGDAIVFRYPRDPRLDYIKRVIALPGETVEVRGGRVLINGAPLDEPYVKEPILYSLAPQVVPPNSYFVLGDNRNYANDSHIWGMVPQQNIVGKVWLRYFPLDRLEVL